ncbi:tape measure protein [Salana multivorans]|uniref:tape measure protein n=1 Tax=Salana multivorans TaxID=120377 RepID=UPI001475AEA9|nr:tape measure protein [Salana multivorans]
MSAAKAGIAYNTLQQTSRTALTTLLGSAEAAAAQMGRLDDFARNSPFAKKTFVTAQQQMLGFGVATQKVLPYLDAVQNAVAAMGGSNQQITDISSIMSQISAASRITAGDLTQFGQHGVDAAELIGSQLGRTGTQIREEITAGTLDAGTALDALAAGMQSRYGGAASDVKSTFAGAFERVKSAWSDLTSELAQPLVGTDGGGILVGLANGAADLMRNFQALPDPVKAATTTVAGVTGGISLLSGALVSSYPKWVKWKDSLNSFITTAGAAGKAVGLLRAAALPLAGVFAAASIALMIWGEKSAATKSRVDSFSETIGNMTSTVATATNNLLTGTNSDWGWFEKWNTRTEWFEMGAESFVEAASMLGQSADDISRSLSMSSEEYDAYSKSILDTSTAMGYGTGVGQEYLNKIGEQRTAMEAAAEAQRIFQELTAGTTFLTEEQAEQTRLAAEAAQQFAQAWLETAQGAGNTFGTISSAYDAVIEKNKEIAQSEADRANEGLAANDASLKSWTDFYKDMSVSHDDWLAQMQEQQRATENWASNYQTAMTQVRGMPAEVQESALAMIQDLVAKGADGMPMLQAWVDGTPEWRQEMIRAFDGKNLATDLVGETPPTIDVLARTALAEEKVRELEEQLLDTTTTTQVDADTTPATLTLDEMLAYAGDANVVVPILSSAGPARTIAEEFLAWAQSTEPIIVCDADTGEATVTVDAFTSWVQSLDPSARFSASTDEATGSVSAFITWADGSRSEVQVDAGTGGAETTVTNFVGTTNERRASIQVSASTSDAEEKISVLTRARRVSVSAFIPGFFGLREGGPVTYRAAGGPVHGPGTGTSDSVPATGPFGSRYQLSNGEHVWTARETAAVGGHGEMLRLRRAALTGRVSYRAGGGSIEPRYLTPRVSPQVYVNTTPTADLSAVRQIVRDAVSEFARVSTTAAADISQSNLAGAARSQGSEFQTRGPMW